MFFQRFGVLRTNSPTRCVSRLRSIGMNVAKSLRKRQHKLLDWIALISSSHYCEKVKMRSLWTSLTLIENSTVVDLQLLMRLLSYFSHGQDSSIYYNWFLL